MLAANSYKPEARARDLRGSLACASGLCHKVMIKALVGSFPVAIFSNGADRREPAANPTTSPLRSDEGPIVTADASQGLAVDQR